MMSYDQRMQKRSQARNELIQLSEVMLLQANAAQWHEALATQKLRRIRIIEYFEQDNRLEQPAELALTIKTLLAVDAEMTCKVEAQQALWEVEMSFVHRHKRAANTYLLHQAI